VQEAPADRDSKKKWKRLIRILIGLAVFVYIIIPAVAYTTIWVLERQERARRPPQVTVPNVIGQDYRAAESALKARGLKMSVLAARSDQDQPVGIIIDQTPLGGESVDVGHDVGVTVGGRPGQQFGQPRPVMKDLRQ
jgi:beta-lactam-binding protein with PASTA domain